MTQEQINVVLASLTVLMPVISFLLNRFFSRKKDTADYSSDLLEIANNATEALRKAREELTASEVNYERTIESIRKAHNADIESIRSEYDARHERLKSRLTELEKVQKIYAIQFDLVTHPNLEVRNISARAMDDLSASQKIRAITSEQAREAKESKGEG